MATFNVLHGRALGGGPAPLERLVEACASLDADVLCLQEIDRGQPRSAGVDQTAAVAAGMGAAAWRFQPALVGEPGGRWRAATESDGDCESGEPGYGVGLVSRLPVDRWHVRFLAAAPVRSPVVVPRPGRPGVILLPDEPRVVLAADLTGLRGPNAATGLRGPNAATGLRGPNAATGLRVATTHLSFVPGFNLVQLRRATRWLASLEGTEGCVLLGDLNAPGPLPRLASGWRPLVRARTFPADRPRFQVDHVLAEGQTPPVAATTTCRLPLSDHVAVVVDLTVIES